jgi:PIN domain nuclease of toxin-antitoxin system
LAEHLADSEFRALPITATHVYVAAGLPLVHKDPFDRMLIAQAKCEDLVIVTRDRFIPRYEVATLPA